MRAEPSPGVSRWPKAEQLSLAVDRLLDSESDQVWSTMSESNGTKALETISSYLNVFNTLHKLEEFNQFKTGIGVQQGNDDDESLRFVQVLCSFRAFPIILTKLHRVTGQAANLAWQHADTPEHVK